MKLQNSSDKFQHFHLWALLSVDFFSHKMTVSPGSLLRVPSVLDCILEICVLCYKTLVPL